MCCWAAAKSHVKSGSECVLIIEIHVNKRGRQNFEVLKTVTATTPTVLTDQLRGVCYIPLISRIQRCSRPWISFWDFPRWHLQWSWREAPCHQPHSAWHSDSASDTYCPEGQIKERERERIESQCPFVGIYNKDLSMWGNSCCSLYIANYFHHTF